jgi:hypothetical protein
MSGTLSSSANCCARTNYARTNELKAIAPATIDASPIHPQQPSNQ